jgi:hypothetical protein
VDIVLLPAVESNRTVEGCNDKPAILFCDAFSGHCTENIVQKLGDHGVILLTYPPHTSYIFPVLDLLLFGVLKRAKKRERHDDERPAQAEHVLRLFHPYEQATTSATVKAS